MLIPTPAGGQLRTAPLLFAALVLTAQSVMAQGLGQQATQSRLEEVRVTAGRLGQATAPGASAARQALMDIPGAIGFVPAADFADDFAQSIGDTLAYTPGVFADTSAQRENRISIRGSGLNSGFERRGINLYRDGVPITRAGGSTEFQEVDPVSLDYIEVFKGANALQYGAASLGGVINMLSPTGVTREERWKVRLEGGSFDTMRANLSYAEDFGAFDTYAVVTRLRSEGYRDHSAVDSTYGFANIGAQLSEGVENRTYLTALQDQFELAGGLSLEEALENPTQAASPVTIGPFFPEGPVTVLDPGPEADDWDRNLDVLRLANSTVFSHDDNEVAVSVWYAWRDLDHAITRFAGIINQEEDEYGLSLRATGQMDWGPRGSKWIIGLQGNTASTDASRYENLFGTSGALLSQSRQKAWNGLVYGELDTRLSDSLRLVLGLQALRAERRNNALLNDVSGRVESDQVNPRLGLLWAPLENVQVFGNLTRGFEPATMSDLTSGGALDFTPLDAQQAWTLELGSRGSLGRVSWDLAIYRSDIENEFLDYGLANGARFISFTDNAGDTTHQGLELGVDLNLSAAALTSRGLDLTWRNTYTLNDFVFENDPVYGNNELAGVPDQIYTSELRLDGANWYAGVNLRWLPESTWVDFANTTRAPGYTLWGITAGLTVAQRLTLFVSAENLADETYISNVSTTANQSIEQSNLYTPGQGRAAFAGLTWAL